MDESYIVVMQDFVETYEYRYPTLEAALRFMTIEMLPCSLWGLDANTGQKRKMEVNNAQKMEEKQKIKRVLTVFSQYLKGTDFYEVFCSEKHGYILLGMSGDGINVFDEASIIPTSEAFVKRMLTEIASDYFISIDLDNTLKTATQPEAVEIRQRWRPYMEQLPGYQYLLDIRVMGSTI